MSETQVGVGRIRKAKMSEEIWMTTGVVRGWDEGLPMGTKRRYYFLDTLNNLVRLLKEDRTPSVGMRMILAHVRPRQGRL